MINLPKIQRFALYLYFFSLNFEIFNILGFGSASRLTGIFYLVTIIPNIKLYIRTDRIKPYIRSVFFFWIFLTFISILYINPSSYNFLDVTILLNILLFWIMINHERLNQGVLLKGMFSFSLGAILLTLLYNAGIGIEYSGGRVSIFGDNENAIAVRLSIACLILIYLVVSDNLSLKLWRFLLLLPIPIMLTFMFETGSRKAFLSFALAFIVGVFFYKSGRKWYKIFIVVTAFIASTFFIQLLLESDVLYNRLLITGEEGNLGGREEIWSKIVPFIQDNIIWGKGKTGYEKFAIQTFGVIRSPHNVLLEVLAYTGIIGFSAYSFFTIRSTWQSFLGYKSSGFLLPFLLLIPTWGLIIGGQALGGKMVWATFAFAVSTIFHNQDNENSLRNR